MPNDRPGEALFLILIALVEKGVHPIGAPGKGNRRLEELFEQQYLAEHAHAAAAELCGQMCAPQARVHRQLFEPGIVLRPEIVASLF